MVMECTQLKLLKQVYRIRIGEIKNNNNSNNNNFYNNSSSCITFRNLMKNF